MLEIIELAITLVKYDPVSTSSCLSSINSLMQCPENYAGGDDEDEDMADADDDEEEDDDFGDECVFCRNFRTGYIAQTHFEPITGTLTTTTPRGKSAAAQRSSSARAS